MCTGISGIEDYQGCCESEVERSLNKSGEMLPTQLCWEWVSPPSGEKGLAVSPKTMTSEPCVPLFVIVFSQVRLFPIINTFIGNLKKFF